jgi:hypothetical protein
MANHIKSLWRGEVKLWKIFWIYGIAAVILIPFLLPYFFVIMSSTFPKIPDIVYIYPSFFIYAAYGLLVIVGIWRSADKYQGPKKWVFLAKLTIITFAVILFYNILTFRQQIEMVKQIQ